jgi:hypothetical protein
MRKVITGEQVAQIYNPDPFARPIWRAPVYQTPAGLILLAWLVKLIARLLRVVFRHPVAAGVLALLAFLWVSIGWPGMTAIIGCAVLVLVIWRCCWPSTFSRWGRHSTPVRVAGLGLPAPLARGNEHRRPSPLLPGPDHRAGPGPGHRDPVRRPGTRPAGLRPVPRPVRRPRRQPGPRLPRHLVPGPLGPVRGGRAGVRPPRRPGRHHPRPAHPRPAKPQGPAGRPPRGRPALAGPPTWHQVWWPDKPAKYRDGNELPVWDDQAGRYVDPATGEILPTWDEALDGIGPYDLPWHVARFGDRFDAQGVLAGSPQAARCIGYLTKYLTKHIGNCHQAVTGPESDHAARLAEALSYQPCSPRCANGLRYGIQPKNARPGLTPGACKGKAHDADHLGYAGRRVLVSRKWSGKTLADHRADRKEWLLRTLGISATDPARYAWELVTPADHDHMDHARWMLHVVADRLRWQMALAEARRRAAMPPDGDLPVSGRAA